jgi:hypothetical protein
MKGIKVDREDKYIKASLAKVRYTDIPNLRRILQNLSVARLSLTLN